MRPPSAPRPHDAAPPPPPPEFAPVPTRSTRHDGWTPARQRDFIVQLAQSGVVAAAARAVSMSAKSAYALRKRDGAAGFVAAWDAACDEGRSRALDAAVAQGFEGVLVPILYRGRQVGVRRVFDPRVLLAALRAIRRADPTRGRGTAEALPAFAELSEIQDRA